MSLETAFMGEARGSFTVEVIWGRVWDDTATNTGLSGAAKSLKRQKNYRGASRWNRHTHTMTLALGPKPRMATSFVLSHPVCDHPRPQECNSKVLQYCEGQQGLQALV